MKFSNRLGHLQSRESLTLRLKLLFGEGELSSVCDKTVKYNLRMGLN